MWRRRVLFGALISIVVVDLGLLAGWLAQRAGDEEIRWEIAALAFTGFATLGLALATYALAQQTQRDVDASNASAEAAQRSAEVGAASHSASIRPILAASPLEHPSTNPGAENGKSVVSLVAPSRNLGSGLAVVVEPRLLTRIPPGATARVTGVGFAVPRDQRVEVVIDVIFSDASEAQKFKQAVNSQGFEVEVPYRDMNGEQHSRTTARAMHYPTTGWDYAELDLYRGNDPEPYARLPRSVTIAAP